MSSQNDVLTKINHKQQQISSEWLDYWEDYSSFNTWQFWFHVFIFVLPLILLYFKLDRKRALQVGFYGFNVHVWFSYFDNFGTKQGLWDYPFQMIPFLPNSIGLDASLVPVLFMLIYQWTTKNQKNYYLYTLLLSLVLSFILKPVLVSLNLFRFYQGTNYFHLFLSYIVIIVLSKLITDLFLHFQKENNPT